MLEGKGEWKGGSEGGKEIDRVYPMGRNID